MLSGYNFWKQVDLNNPYKTAKALAEAAGISYRHMVQQRAGSTIPKAEDLIKLADTMNVSIEFLLTGNRDAPRTMSPEAERVEQDPAMRRLVRMCMDEPGLLSALDLVITAARRTVTEKIS